MSRDAESLEGKRVLATCQSSRAEELLLTLSKAGALAVHVPLIEIKPPSDDYASLDLALSELASFSWVAFTSRNGARAFFSRLRGGLPEVGTRLAAVGPGTAEEVVRMGGRAPVVAARHDAEGLLELLGGLVKGGERVLWPRAGEAREVLAKGLRLQGALVFEAEAYSVSMPDEGSCKRLVEVVSNGGIDAVLFDSPSAVRNFVKILGRERAAEFLSKSSAVPVGPVTARAMEQELGLSPGAKAIRNRRG